MPSSEPRGDLAKNLIFSLASLLVTLGLCELLLRAAYPLYADYNTEMWRYAAELKTLTGDPDLPFVHAPRKSARLYGVEIRTNNAGWRSDRDVEIAKAPGRRRILVLGDSIAAGWGVSLQDSFPYLLEKKLRADPGGDIEVINTGVGNYNTAAEVATLERALPYKPDLVVLALSINDAEILPFYHPSPWARLKSRSYLYCFLWDKLTLLSYRFRFARAYPDYYSSLYRDGSPERRAFEAAISRLLAVVRQERIPLLVAAIPEMHGFKDYRFAGITDLTRRLFTAGGDADFLDLRPAFAPYEPSSTWVSKEDAHPNALGHKVMAEAIHARLKERRWR